MPVPVLPGMRVITPQPIQISRALNSRRSVQQAEPNQLPAWNRPRSQERQQERKQMVSEIRHYYNSIYPGSEAMQHVPRHCCASRAAGHAYVDSPLPIGYTRPFHSHLSWRL
jgi:hypothetical protein